MKYLPTINLWSDGMIDALLSGQLRLQRGQWVRCGSTKPSRFFGVTTTGSIWCAHPHNYDNFHFWVRQGCASNMR